MPPNRQKIYNVASAHLQGREFSRKDLLRLLDKYHPGTNHDSILPSDYICRTLKPDASNDGNRGNYAVYPRFLERVGRDREAALGFRENSGGVHRTNTRKFTPAFFGEKAGLYLGVGLRKG